MRVAVAAGAAGTAVGRRVGVNVRVRVGVGVRVAVGVRVGVAVGVRVRVAVAERVGERVGDGGTVRITERVGTGCAGAERNTRRCSPGARETVCVPKLRFGSAMFWLRAVVID